MRYLLLTTFFLLSLTLSAQSNNIGIQLVHKLESGLSASLRIERMITLKDGIKLEFGTNGSKNIGSYFAKAGYFRNVYQNNKIKILTGFDFEIERVDRSIIDQEDAWVRTFSIPFDIRYKLTDRLDLNAGFSVPLSIQSDQYRTTSDEKIIDARLGVNYRF